MARVVVGAVSYRALTDESVPFTVNAQSGHIQLTSGQLDHELVTSYLLTVRAQLLADQSLFAQTQVML